MTALKAQNISTMVLISQVEKPELWKKCPSVPTHTSPAPMVLTVLKFPSQSNTFHVLSGKCLTSYSPHLLFFQVRIILKQPPGHPLPLQPLCKDMKDLMNKVHP